MTETLLDKAKTISPRKREHSYLTEEILDVALAYLAGGITGRQLCAVLDKRPNEAYNVASQIIFTALRTGRLTVKKVHP